MHPAAMKSGFRSDIGLAVAMLPAMHCQNLFYLYMRKLHELNVIQNVIYMYQI